MLLAKFKPTMRSNFLLALFFTFGVLLQAGAQTNVIDQVKETVKAGSAKELSKYLYANVDLTLDGTVQSISKAQAEFALRDFFRQHPPNEVNVIHQGKSKAGQPYAIFQYRSGNDTFRLFMKIKSSGNQQLLDDIRFTKE